MFEDLFDNLVDKTLIAQNSLLIGQDLGLAVKLKDRLLKLSKNEENFRSKKFYFEAIFLILRFLESILGYFRAI